ncbi:MAG: hypothetical protein ACYC27_22215 [Armatimonadota bacterium]
MYKFLNYMMLACVVAVIMPGVCAEEKPENKAEPVVWMMPPPWKDNGGCLRELIMRDVEWVETRKKIDGLGYWPWLLNVHFSDNEIRTLFSRLKDWNLKFAFEGPIVKGVDASSEMKPMNAKSAFEQLERLTKRFKSLGMPKIDRYAFDEPIYASRYMIPHQVAQGTITDAAGLPNDKDTPKQRMDYGIRETAAFIESMRKAYPGTSLGNIEPYPALSYDEIIYAIDNIQAECAKRGVKGMDFFRMDVDWAGMNNWLGGSWKEVRQIEDYCRSKGIAFSLIYIGLDYDLLKQKGIEYDMQWYVGMMHQGSAYTLAGGSPDEYVLESWLHTPAHAVPESDMTTFTRSVLDFCNVFVPGRKNRIDRKP